MNTKRLIKSGMLAVLFLILAVSLAFAQAPLGTAFTYQGQLKSEGQPYTGTCDFQFGLYDVPTEGTPLGNLPLTGVPLTEGFFTVQLDFGAYAFTGEARYLDISVRCPAGTGDFTQLQPRQQLTAAPYALYATNNWSVTGNAGTTPGTNYLGTSDDQALEIKVNNQRVFRFEPNTTSPNLIGGYSGNAITTGVYGATISGGGTSNELNSVTDNYGSIGGGGSNQAGNADPDLTNAIDATVAGGHGNKASYMGSFVGGGLFNLAGGFVSSISGGEENEASGVYSYIGGGGYNTASGYGSTIPGGYANTASGMYSFAAGKQANATNNGSFVWADSQSAAYNDHGINTFNVRAQNGAFIDAAPSKSPGLRVINTSSGTSAGDGTAVLGVSISNYGYGLNGWNYVNGVGVGAWSYGGNLIEAYAGGFPLETLRFYVDNAGNVRYAGTSAPMVAIPSPTGGASSYVSLYGIAAAEAWYEDLGSSSLASGKVKVSIDPLFAQTVNLTEDYQVQVTATCNEPVLLYVSEKTTSYFTVQGVRLDGKPSNCAFDYRISAKAVGYETVRLEAVDIPEPVISEREE